MQAREKLLQLFTCNNCRAAWIRYFRSTVVREPKTQYDAVVVGGGHNGLVSAAYLAASGLKVCVLERRHVVGGAAVTEEIIPGFKFSRASYLLSLLRPIVMQELELKKHGLRYHLKDPASFTPLRNSKLGLTLGGDVSDEQKQIAQFSQRDAEAYPKYKHFLRSLMTVLDPLLDLRPQPVQRESRYQRLNELLGALRLFGPKSFKREVSTFICKTIPEALISVSHLGVKGCLELYELMTAPESKVLCRWFESEPLRATLATDGIVGHMGSPHQPATGYVLLHHVMGEIDGKREPIVLLFPKLSCAQQTTTDTGHHIRHIDNHDLRTLKVVKEFLVGNDGKIEGVQLSDGETIKAKIVLSNATPKVTFIDLMPSGQDLLQTDFLAAIKSIDYASSVTKINVATNKLPQFASLPHSSELQPQHQASIFLNCETIENLHNAYVDALAGEWSKRPYMEMLVPSSVDRSIAPPGGHVCTFFTQFTPYHLSGGRSWDDAIKKEYAEHVFANVEEYFPGFRQSIVGYEVLPPPELEKLFGLTGGNIFHGAMSLDQLYFSRPAIGCANYRTPVKGLYLCGSGAHPGGGVMGAPGRLAALTALADLRIRSKLK